MRFHQFLAYVAVAAGAGVSLATAGTATATPVENAWPFGDFQLPGYSAGGQLTNDGFFDTGVLPWTDDGGDYSTHFAGIQVPFLGYLIHQAVFDSANPAVPDGTTWDGISLPGFADTVIAAPGIGIGDQITFGTLTNSFVVDTAGVQDVLTLGDYPPMTLFDVPMDLSALL